MSSYQKYIIANILFAMPLVHGCCDSKRNAQLGIVDPQIETIHMLRSKVADDNLDIESRLSAVNQLRRFGRTEDAYFLSFFLKPLDSRLAVECIYSIGEIGDRDCLLFLEAIERQSKGPVPGKVGVALAIAKKQIQDRWIEIEKHQNDVTAGKGVGAGNGVESHF